MTRFEFLKVAIVSSLLIFMAISGLFFKKFIGTKYEHTFPEYSVSCDCHDTNVLPDDQYSLSYDWAIKEVVFISYGAVMGLVSLLRANTRVWGFDLLWMWFLFLVSLPVSYWISYETMIIAKYWFSYPCIIQIIYLQDCARRIE